MEHLSRHVLHVVAQEGEDELNSEENGQGCNHDGTAGGRYAFEAAANLDLVDLTDDSQDPDSITIFDESNKTLAQSDR